MPTLEQLLSAKPEELEKLTDAEIREFAAPYAKMTIPHLANPAGLKFGGTSHVTGSAKLARQEKIKKVGEKQKVLDTLAGLDGFDFMKDLLKGNKK